MSDFFIDFGTHRSKSSKIARKVLSFYDDMTALKHSNGLFDLVVTRADDLDIWGSYESMQDGILVALCGRIALDKSDWNLSERIGGQGGRACKYIYSKYISDGVQSFNSLNGNYVIVLYDPSVSSVFLVTDRCGMVPAFCHKNFSKLPVISSHPDLLARITNESENIDFVSVTEFLSTGKVSPPFTYYENIISLDFSSIIQIKIDNQVPSIAATTSYFSLDYEGYQINDESVIAEKLASSFKSALSRRTLPLFGRSAIALSGGLDSRAYVAAVNDKSQLQTFCFFDEENLEFKISQELAQQFKVNLVPLKRPFDYYGENAGKGVRIYGGMGNFVNNHFIGFRNSFKEYGFQNIITGFYCDYLFKGLAQNVSKNKITRRETLRPFNYSYYRPCYWFEGKYKEHVAARLGNYYSEALTSPNDEKTRLLIEAKRVFPLCYEPDNAETTISQRVLPWYLPIVDNDILESYLSIPARSKLNNSLYVKMLAILCPKPVIKILNSNTGAPVDASQGYIAAVYNSRMVLQKIKNKIAPSIKASGSWPNWLYYINNSALIRDLWLGDTYQTEPLFSEIFNKNIYQDGYRKVSENNIDYFTRLLTIKLWYENRI